MMAGFLLEIDLTQVELTCCVPYPLPPLKARFPEVTWLPYDAKTRSQCIQEADAWLGLGGSPFQSTVSRWFIDHLIEESNECQIHHKPMYFLGVGGQDKEAFIKPELQSILVQAEHIWVRDNSTYKYLAENNLYKNKVTQSADLGHLFLKQLPFPSPVSNSLAVTLNFDYKPWDRLGLMLERLSQFPAKEFIWNIQETRSLPFAEKSLYEQLTPSQKALWKPHELDKPTLPLSAVILSWPTSEWALNSRYHATLAAAWAGTKAVVLDTNIKLQGVAKECGFENLSLLSSPDAIAEALIRAKASNKTHLYMLAKEAQSSVKAFLESIGL